MLFSRRICSALLLSLLLLVVFTHGVPCGTGGVVSYFDVLAASPVCTSINGTLLIDGVFGYEAPFQMLDQITAISGDFTLQTLVPMDDIGGAGGLRSLTSVGGNIQIGLTAFAPGTRLKLPSLQTVGGNLIIELIDVKSIDLPSLSSVGGEFKVALLAQSLLWIRAPQLTSVQDVTIQSCPALESVEFGRLVSLPGQLTLESFELYSMYGFRSLTSVGNILLNNLQRLRDASDLNIQGSVGSLRLISLPYLRSLRGFEGITTITTKLELSFAGINDTCAFQPTFVQEFFIAPTGDILSYCSMCLTDVANQNASFVLWILLPISYPDWVNLDRPCGADNLFCSNFTGCPLRPSPTASPSPIPRTSQSPSEFTGTATVGTPVVVTGDVIIESNSTIFISSSAGSSQGDSSVPIVVVDGQLIFENDTELVVTPLQRDLENGAVVVFRAEGTIAGVPPDLTVDESQLNLDEECEELIASTQISDDGRSLSVLLQAQPVSGDSGCNNGSDDNDQALDTWLIVLISVGGFCCLLFCVIVIVAVVVGGVLIPRGSRLLSENRSSGHIELSDRIVR